MKPDQVSMKKNADGSMGVNVALNEDQQKKAAVFGLNALKKNMTKENVSAAASYTAKNAKVVGSAAMGALSSFGFGGKKEEKKPEPPKEKKSDNDDFFSNFANFKA